MDQLQEERAIAGAVNEPHGSRPNSGLPITLAELRMMSTVFPFPPHFLPSVPLFEPLVGMQGPGNEAVEVVGLLTLAEFAKHCLKPA